MPPLTSSEGRSQRLPTAGGASKPSAPLREQVPVPPLRRPPSTGTATGTQFHKGLVNALQDVLRKQRQGVFPGPDGQDTPSVRPNTQGGNSFTTTLGSASGGSSSSDRVEELIRRKKTEWAQRRWQQSQQSEKKELERDISSANSFARRQRFGSANSSSGINSRLFDGGFDDEDDSGFQWRVLQVLERQEQREREHLSQQLLKNVSEMMANFATFIKTKVLLSTSSAAGRGAPADSTSPAVLSPISGIQGRRMSSASSTGFMFDDGSDHPNAPMVASNSMRSRPGTASRQSAILSEAQTAVAVEEFRQRGNHYYEQNDFCSAYLVYSKALELVGGTDQIGSGSSARNTTIPVLLANRAATNMMLLNYDACAKDCLAALQLDPSNVKVQQRLAKAYTLAGQHRSAQTHYAAAAKLIEEHRTPNDSLRVTLQDEWSSSLILDKMRRSLETEQYAECVALSASLKAFHGEPAVVFTRCAALLLVDPATARQELSKYFSTLECPTSIVSSAASSSLIGAGDVITITGAYNSHYCDVLLLLAKASFYCGQHYLTIASSYVKQCLALRPEHRHAQQFVKVLNALEAKMDEANQQFQSGKFGDAHVSLSAALSLDTNNKKIRGALFNSRAEASVKIGNVAAAISDCTSALECDPMLVKALTRRAKCFADIGDFSRAVRDMERAAELNPSLAEDVRAFRAQQQQDNTAYSSFQRRFGSAGPRPQTCGSQSAANDGDANGSGSFPSWGSSRPGTGNQSVFGQQQVVCPYSVLLLPKFSSVEQVKTQYKKLILQYHPDKVVNQPQNVREACAVKFRSISDAYGVLSDVSSKQQYDCAFR